MLRGLPNLTLFPYTTLFRSRVGAAPNSGSPGRKGPGPPRVSNGLRAGRAGGRDAAADTVARRPLRSEEHTSELQSRQYLVCRLLLEKKNKNVHLRTEKLASA